MRGELVRVACLAVVPYFDDGEVVVAILLVNHVEAQVAIVLAACLGKYPQRLDDLVAARGRNIDMAHHIGDTLAMRRRQWSNESREAEAVIDRRHQDGLELVAKLLGVRRGRMGVE